MYTYLKGKNFNSKHPTSTQIFQLSSFYVKDGVFEDDLFP